MPRKPKSTAHLDAEVAWAKVPTLDKLTCIQAQYFENGGKAQGNSSPHTLKLWGWTRQWDIRFKPSNEDWRNTVQLRDPATVLAWARDKHAVGEVTADDLERYEAVHENCAQRLKEDGYKLALVGHFNTSAKPSGRYFFAGCFVVFTIDADDGIAALLCRHQEEPIPVLKWKPAKGKAKYSAIEDLKGILERQKNKLGSAGKH